MRGRDPGILRVARQITESDERNGAARRDRLAGPGAGRILSRHAVAVTSSPKRPSPSSHARPRGVFGRSEGLSIAGGISVTAACGTAGKGVADAASSENAAGASLNGRHRRHESVAELRHRFDETRTLLTLAQGAADEPDMFGQIGFIDVAARPEKPHQLLLTDHMARVLDEQHQRVEYFWRQRNGFPGLRQPALVGLELEVPESIDALFQYFPGA